MRYLKRVAPGAPQTAHLPDVLKAGLIGGKEQRPNLGSTPVVEARRPVRLKDGCHAAKPGRVVAAAGKRPLSGENVAAVDLGSLALTRAPRQDTAVVRSEDRHRGGWIEKATHQRAPGRLDEAPGRAPVGTGNFFDDAHERKEVGLFTTVRVRNQ